MEADSGIGEQIERLTRQTGTPVVGEFKGVPVTTDENGEIVRRDDLLLRPLVRKEAVRIKSVDSFIAYVNDHTDPKVQSAMFSDVDANAFGVVFDYEDATGGLTRSHTAYLGLEETLSLKAWKSKNNKGMTQEDFALFIEENVADIVDPAGSVMMQVATELRAIKDVTFDQKVALDNGANVFSYKEEVKGTFNNGQIAVPKEFSIGITMYRGQTDGYKVTCKLRYRVGKDSGLVMWYSIPDLERAEENAYADVKKQIAAGFKGEVPMQYDAKIPFTG